MNKAYRLVVFDWEGTLGEDTFGHVLNVLAIEAARMQFGELDRRLIRQYVVLGLALAVKKSFPQLSMYQQEQLLHAVQASLATNSMDAALISGAKSMVEQIYRAGFELAIATNKGAQSLQRALQTTELDVFFKVTRSAGQTPAKPCPQMLEEIMDMVGVSAAQTLMIGDSVTDMEMASLIGVDAIGVDFYHLQDAELRAAGALDVFDDYHQLAEYLQLPGEKHS